MKCFACGADKDLSVEVIYPYEEGGITRKKKVPQLLIIECEAEGETPDRMAIMCHECWRRLSVSRGIDMWISQACWESLNPTTLFGNLPTVPPHEEDLEKYHERWKAENYDPQKKEN